MGDVIVDLLLPGTDRAVAWQWLVMGVVWAVVVAWSFKWRQEYRIFVLGLAITNLAWFAARAIH